MSRFLKECVMICRQMYILIFLSILGSGEHSSYPLLLQEQSEIWYSLHFWGEWVQRQGPVPSCCNKECTIKPQFLLSCLEWGGGSGGISATAGGNRGTQSQSNKGEMRERERERERERLEGGVEGRITIHSRGDTVHVLSPCIVPGTYLWSCSNNRRC